ncbi:MAG TPA: hypothetical protein VGW34_09655 [Allosphingosinicella sp.]|nr:hypothetical protein [Allosphingosinicella sp.]
MSEQGTPRAGGFILAAAIIAGGVGGTVSGQISAGILIGLAAGVVLALMVWRKDRR